MWYVFNLGQQQNAVVALAIDISVLVEMVVRSDQNRLWKAPESWVKNTELGGYNEKNPETPLFIAWITNYLDQTGSEMITFMSGLLSMKLTR